MPGQHQLFMVLQLVGLMAYLAMGTMLCLCMHTVHLWT